MSSPGGNDAITSLTMSIPFCNRKCHVLGRFFSPSASAAAQATVDELTLSDFLNFSF
jgi:hypothetical protein